MASTTNVNNNNGLGGAITPATTSATTPPSTSVTTNLAGQVQANRAATTSYPIINLAPSQKYYTKISVNKLSDLNQIHIMYVQQLAKRIGLKTAP